MHVTLFHVAPPFVDTSMLDTATLSDAVPLIVNGLADALFNVAPLAGVDTIDEGFVTSAVVNENE